MHWSQKTIQLPPFARGCHLITSRVIRELALNHLVPESLDYIHTAEGLDDMPAHVKSSLLGCSLSIPITNGTLALGTWQGIYLCEHRDRAQGRSLVLTVMGDEG